MIDRILTLSLTLTVLLGSTLAIGSDLLAPSVAQPFAPAATVGVLPRVVITGHVVSADTVAQAGDAARETVQ